MGNNPLSYVDPLGLAERSADAVKPNDLYLDNIAAFFHRLASTARRDAAGNFVDRDAAIALDAFINRPISALHPYPAWTPPAVEAELRQSDRLVGSTVGGTSFADFLLNSPDHIGASFGQNSWSLAFWNVFVGGFADASNDALHGDYTAAAIGIGTSVVKPARILKHIPGRVQSRINISNQGISDALRKHADGRLNKSQFTIQEAEIRALLGSKEVIGSPAAILESGGFVRQVDVGRTIGNLPANAGGQSTSILTVITDERGNLINTFPGPLRY